MCFLYRLVQCLELSFLLKNIFVYIWIFGQIFFTVVPCFTVELIQILRIYLLIG